MTDNSVFGWFADAANWTGSSGVPARVAEHVIICAWALLVAFAIALPIGVWLGHINRLGLIITSIGNLGRAIPIFALLILLASWEPIGVSDLAAVIALAIFAIPPVLTNAFIGVRDVDSDCTESARGMGMTAGQVLRGVELPLAVPVLFAGIRTSTVQVVATATLAAFVGAGGLGRFVVDGFGRQDAALMLAGVVLVATLCIGIELLMGWGQRALTPPGLKTAPEIAR